jgi:PadR family transcriptional regulator PadR
MKDLTKLEEVVMIAIWKLGEEAYGVEIKKKVKEILGKEYFYNTLYTTFLQLVQKRYISKHFGEPTAIRGGKRKVYFHLTKSGMNVLEKAFERQRKVWGGITRESFEKEQAS